MSVIYIIPPIVPPTFHYGNGVFLLSACNSVYMLGVAGGGK